MLLRPIPFALGFDSGPCPRITDKLGVHALMLLLAVLVLIFRTLMLFFLTSFTSPDRAALLALVSGLLLAWIAIFFLIGVSGMPSSGGRTGFAVLAVLASRQALFQRPQTLSVPLLGFGCLRRLKLTGDVPVGSRQVHRKSGMVKAFPSLGLSCPSPPKEDFSKCLLLLSFLH